MYLGTFNLMEYRVRTCSVLGTRIRYQLARKKVVKGDEEKRGTVYRLQTKVDLEPTFILSINIPRPSVLIEN